MRRPYKKVLLMSLYSAENLAVRLLQPLVKERGHDCDILFFEEMKKNSQKYSLRNAIGSFQFSNDPPMEESYERVREFLDHTRPDIVGINVSTIYYHIAVKISKLIRERSNAIVVWGGPHAMVAPVECYDHADFVCTGEGVTAFPDFVDAVAEDRDYANINGFAYKKDGQVVENPPAPLVQELDSLPFTDFSGNDKYYILEGKLTINMKSMHLFGCIDEPYKPTYRIMTSWGCPFKCAFCINSKLRSKIRRRSVDSVISELKLAKYRNPYISLIVFYDDVFTMQKDWCEEFAEKYSREIALPFFCYSHPKFADMAILEPLRRAGMVLITMGIQSGSGKIRRMIGRKETNDEIIRAARMFDQISRMPYKRFGFQQNFDLLHGNPLESEEDLNEALLLLCEFPKNFVIHLYTITHFPNYPLTDFFLEKGFISPNEIQGEHYDESKVVSYYSSSSPEESASNERMHNFYHIAFNLAQYKHSPRWFLRMLARDNMVRRFFYKRQDILFKIARCFRLLSILGNGMNVISYIRLISYKLYRDKDKLMSVEATLNAGFASGGPFPLKGPDFENLDKQEGRVRGLPG